MYYVRCIQACTHSYTFFLFGSGILGGGFHLGPYRGTLLAAGVVFFVIVINRNQAFLLTASALLSASLFILPHVFG